MANAGNASHVAKVGPFVASGPGRAFGPEMLRRCLPCLVLVACSGDDSPVVGPFTGEPQRFVVDSIDMQYASDIHRHDADLNGDERADNAIGGLVRTLATSYRAARTEPNDVLAARQISPVVIVQAEDLETDDVAGVTWLASETGDSGARAMGARIVDGVITTNLIRETALDDAGGGRIDAPVIKHARPLQLVSGAMQMTLTPDGAGGFDGTLQALLDHDVLIEAARVALTDQITFAPEQSRPLWELIDVENDGAYATSELWRNTLVASLLTPDIRKGERDWHSFAFGVHLVPCAQGACGADTMPIVDACDDLARDGDETGVDCGGTCGRCAVGRECSVGDQCQSGTCEGGTCTAPTCTDGVKNGLEAALDCGGACSMKCPADAPCGYDFDCASGTCVGGTFGIGKCSVVTP